MRTVADDVDAVGRMTVVPTILETMARITGMRFTAVARVTDTTWTACAVRDEISFGLVPGSELDLVSTICNEIRQHGRPVLFGSASADPLFCDHHTPRQYGFESYVSIPITLRDGSFFGTLCAIDPVPAKLDDPTILRMLEMFAQLIGMHLDALDRYDQRGAALVTARGETERLDEENRRFAALAAERERAESRMTRELKDTRRLRDVAARLIAAEETSTLLQEILDAALEIVEADGGTIQLLDEDTQRLTFAATKGFGHDMLSHFAQVDAASGSPCGVALASGERVFVVFDDPAQANPDGSNQLHRAAGYRCAQSTPLRSRSGRALGMFSTHWSERRELTERELRFLDLLGRQAADLIERDLVQRALAATEQQLREEGRRKDEFIAVLAHELRNPLAPIRTGIEILKGVPRDPTIDRVRPMMERQVVHMVRLIDDLLDVSRISSGRVQLRREMVDIGAVIGSAVEANRAAIEAAGIELSVELDDESRVLDGDPTRLSQVFSNVLHNSAKFTPRGGRIAVRAHAEPAHTAGPATQVIRISDNGIGIARDQLGAIFDLFVQASPDSVARHGGMGIGLALARRLMEMHGGSISAESAGAGQGSEFTIRLPLPAQASVAPSAKAAPPVGDLAALRVLVVDDNEDAADAIDLVLAQHGAVTRVAYGALQALRALGDFEPRLVLLDIGMPGVDGYEACRRIRAVKGNAVCIVALTGWGQEEDRQRAAAAGFDAHLTKPVEFARLIDIAKSLGVRHPADA